MNKKICVFCSSSDEIDASYFTGSEEIVMPLVKGGYDLVYGGSDLGLMGYTARLFYNNKRRVTSIIPEKIFKAVGNPDFIEDSFVVNSMHERKLKMREMSDCFMALPGGFGTFEELLEVITLKQLGYIDKPIVIADVNNYYSELIASFEKMFSEKFANKNHRNLYLLSDNPEEIFRYISEYKPFDTNSKWQLF